MLEKKLVGKRIKSIADERGWSISQLAEYFGKKPNSFQQYINGKLYPTAAMIAKILEDYNPEHLVWLLNGYPEEVKDNKDNNSISEPRIKYRGKNTFIFESEEYPLIDTVIKELLDSIMARLANAERQKLEAESETLKILKENVRLDRRCRELEAENQALKTQQMRSDVTKTN